MKNTKTEDFLKRISELNEISKKIYYSVPTGNLFTGFGIPKENAEKYINEHPENEPIIDRLIVLCDELNHIVPYLD